jgi:hypothetical protein
MSLLGDMEKRALGVHTPFHTARLLGGRETVETHNTSEVI